MRWSLRISWSDPVRSPSILADPTAARYSSLWGSPMPPSPNRLLRPISTIHPMSKVGSPCEFMGSPNHRVSALPSDILTQELAQLDGGWLAWRAVMSSFLIHFCVFGVQYAYGVYQQYYQQQKFQTASRSALSFVGAAGPALMHMSGAFAGILAERFSFRSVVLAGTLIMTTSMVLASWATEVWQLAITQGVLFGLGCALCINPGASLPSQWWVRRQSLAAGIAVSGSGFGGLFWERFARRLLPRLGVAWTLRATGGALLILLLAALALMHARIPPRKPVASSTKSPLLDGHPPSVVKRPPLWHAFRDPIFRALFISRLLIPLSYLCPFFFLAIYVAEVCPTHTPAFASTLLAVINICSIVGRIVTGWVADKLGNVNTYFVSVATTGVAILALWLPAGDSVPLLVAFAAVFGWSAGGFIALNGPLISQLFGLAQLPSMMGLSNGANGIGNLMGTPIAGALITAAGTGTNWTWPAHEFTGAIAFAGITSLLAACGIAYLRFVLLDGRLWVKV
ncbi:hypothetical protein GGF32_003828 [Allomyces javanicus]|nr:hypothetical protein GGF32_003828 [Allomyces javanicus]